MGNKKMGRPTSDPKTQTLKIRLSDSTYQQLEDCATKLNTSKADIIRKGIALIYEQMKG